MSKFKKKVYEKKSFESTGAPGDTSANIYMSMLVSDAWRELTAKQQVLYMYCKAQYYAEKHKPNGNQEAFTMNQTKWCGLYNLYTKEGARHFYRDMTALIEKGFITCLESGKNTRTKSIYAFSSKWRVYGTSQFEILPSEKTVSMFNKEEKAKKAESAAIEKQRQHEEYLLTTGYKIKQAREAKGIVQRELAQIVGIGKSAMARYELNQSLTPPDVLQRIADALEVNISVLTSDSLHNNII